ncbi:MAG: hypothetical protein CEN89_134 [Candidatus Berkelbacteria bacterium Licking1014_7]|uniref:Dephospho-CoA kinase n=1 Tax=Candidatus Berkelbacteria bacterium Licking1014_7 TaxID=2017147 RepID=A0A554LKG5_9BACT|nr:MAG: hypothetical protein CEN89_134 [Candidatus Berkelbacteria bacterium Licking1014_7]
MKTIIAIVGMPGAGKSEVADYLIKKDYSYIRLGQITLDKLSEMKLVINEKNERKIREEFRKKFGMAAFAILNFPKINRLKGNIVIDGLYSWEEYLEFKKRFRNFYVLAVYSNPATRYGRLISRSEKHKNDIKNKYRSIALEEAKARDVAEIEHLNKGGPIAMANFTIVNQSNKKKLKEKVDEFLQQI